MAQKAERQRFHDKIPFSMTKDSKDPDSVVETARSASMNKSKDDAVNRVRDIAEKNEYKLYILTPLIILPV